MKKMTDANRVARTDPGLHGELDGSFNEDASEAVLDASRKIALIYADLLKSGLSDELVGRAMIGATIQLYDAIGLGAQLPTLLRRVASNIETELLEQPEAEH